MVINKDVVYPGDFQFEIRSDLWKSLDLDNKAMTILHESLYAWRSHFDPDSRNARFLNGVLASYTTKEDWVLYAKGAGESLIGLPSFVDLGKNVHVPESISSYDNFVMSVYANKVSISANGIEVNIFIAPKGRISLTQYNLVAHSCLAERCTDRVVDVAYLNKNFQLDSVMVDISCLFEKSRKAACPNVRKRPQIFLANATINVTTVKADFLNYSDSMIVKTNGNAQIIQIKAEGKTIDSFEFNDVAYHNDWKDGQLVFNIDENNEMTSFEIIPYPQAE